MERGTAIKSLPRSGRRMVDEPAKRVSQVRGVDPTLRQLLG